MDKSEVTYNNLFNHVRILTRKANPVPINMDYERSAINSANNTFRGAEISCCFFHLSQYIYKRVQSSGRADVYRNDDIYKRVQSNGRADVYRNDDLFRTNVKMIGAIAFVIVDVVETFERLAHHCGQNEQVILDYFETNYIGELRRGRRRPPLFEHDLWIVYDRVLNNRPRTINAVEGWHNALSQSLGQSHANVWTFVDCLKREEAMTRLTIAQIQAGCPAPVQKRMYRNVNEQLSNIVVDYDNRDRIDYLRAISYVI